MLTWEIYTKTGEEAGQIACSSEVTLKDGLTYRYEVWQYEQEGDEDPNLDAELWVKMDEEWDLAEHVTMSRNTCFFTAIGMAQDHYQARGA